MPTDNVMQNIFNAQQQTEAKAQAQVKLALLKQDGGWIQKYMSGDAEAVKTFRDLTSTIAGVPSNGPATVGLNPALLPGK
jgi:hypothetical protein